MTLPPTVHAGAVLVGGCGVLIRGAPGSGKSALILGLLDSTADARLIADDRVVLSADGGTLVASAPAALAGKLEIRGWGIVDRPHTSPAAVGLVVDLAPLAECPRLPEPGDRRTTVDGVVLPRLILPIGAPDGPVRVRAAVRDLATRSV